jgi:phospholipase A1
MRDVIERTSRQRRRACLVAAVVMVAASPLHGAENADVSRCAGLPDRERLRCYDDLFAPGAAASQHSTQSAEARPAAAPAALSAPGTGDADGHVGLKPGCKHSPLARQWDLEQDDESKLYQLIAHKQNYVLPVRYSTSPNNRPVSPNFGPAQDQSLDHTELKFQLSMKVKAAEQLGGYADLWFGYTQQSSWQAYNGANSRPFRETDYEPEAMLVFPMKPDFTLLGFQPRFANLGFVHQSNGQSDPLSRSWNRIYTQFGLESGRFALMVRPWYRIPESPPDDNGDIEHYLGYGDIVGIYKSESGENTVSVLLRNNLQTQSNRGFVRLDWSLPIPFLPQAQKIPVLNGRTLKFYVQFSTGYGETLIDYNHYQTTIGVGVLLTDWM